MSQDLEFKELGFSNSELVETVFLLQKCFPHATKFNVHYLTWLYVDNPLGKAVGYNCYKDNELVGHYACIPLKAIIEGKETRGLLSLNTATDPRFQGKGIFKKLAIYTYNYASELGYQFVCGVANSRSTTLFTKLLKFDHVTSLEAKVGLGNFYKQREESKKIKLANQFIPIWEEDSLYWRMQNPENPLQMSSEGVLYGSTAFPAISIQGKALNITREFIQEHATQKLPIHRRLGPYVSLGIRPKEIKCSSVCLDIPNKLRPAPLNFIFKNLNNKGIKLSEDRIFFSFIDFDAY